MWGEIRNLYLAFSQWRWEVKALEFGTQEHQVCQAESLGREADSGFLLEGVRGERREKTKEWKVNTLNPNGYFQTHTHTHILGKHIAAISPNIEENKKERVNVGFSMMVTSGLVRSGNRMERTMCLFEAGFGQGLSFRFEWGVVLKPKCGGQVRVLCFVKLKNGFTDKNGWQKPSLLGDGQTSCHERAAGREPQVTA